MTRSIKYLISGVVLFFAGAAIFTSQASLLSLAPTAFQEPDSTEPDTLANVKAVGPQFKLHSDPAFPAADLKDAEGIQLKQPSNLRSDVTFDPKTKQYVFTNKIGNIDYRQPAYMSMREFQKYDMRRTIHNYWKSQANGGKSTGQRGFRPAFNIGAEAFDKVFGSSTISIVPQGQAELIFGINVATNENPQIAENFRTVTSFDFQEKIQMNVTGSIGERLKLGINYNTDATFDFENKTKLEYAGDEDDIIKKVEAGDVTLPLPGTLITGSQSLFGIKTEMQFGKLNVTTVLSQQKGQTQVIQVQGGAQVTEFEVSSDEYEANKHFFLSHTFKDGYDDAHKLLPVINSAVYIKKIEVWVTNRKGSFKDSRTFYAFTDLGENNPNNLANADVKTYSGFPYPDNDANTLFNQVKDSVHNQKYTVADTTRKNVFEKIESARKLLENEYSLDPVLGYISLNAALNADEVLAVAYEYEVQGKVYRVGELSINNQDNKPLVLKLIKGHNLSPSKKNWDLMMKNIYNLGAYDLSSDDFYLNILYHDDNTGTDVNYLPEKDSILGKLNLLRLFNFDRINSQRQNNPDGVFDFLEGITIDKKYGRIIFPMREPFGKGIDTLLAKKGASLSVREKYRYLELYNSTQTKARLVAEKNKFKLKGTYKSSSSSEIYLNAMNVPQGSVKVTSGGMPLRENEDYVVDYALGTVKIINSGIMSSGQPIKVSLENNSMFNVQTKTLIGSHFDYKVSDDFNIGASILHLNERPLTKKVNIGDEPISNTIWGLNTSYRTQSQFLTTLVDKIPLIDTKEPSVFTFTGEFAQLIPGSSSAIGKNGIAYIDDFEGSQTKIDMMSRVGWSLSSTPVNDSIPEATLTNSLDYGKNRAKISWYIIDQLFYRTSSLTPQKVIDNKQWAQNPYARQINETDLFENRQSPNGTPTYLPILNVTFYPQLKGPYNFDTNIDQDGNLRNPQNRWGGMMKSINSSDFEAANIEYVEFWMMDPFARDSFNSGGKLYFDLGDVSEDILKDGKQSFEQGIAAEGSSGTPKTSVWGVLPDDQPNEKSFSTSTTTRLKQDVGFDGMGDAQEADKAFVNADYIAKLDQLKAANQITAEAYNRLVKDPASDDFRYFKDATFDEADGDNGDIIHRYMDYNNVDGNSPDSKTEVKSSYSTPDMEDINDDNTMNEAESFYEYEINLRPGKQEIGTNYIVDKRPSKDVMWYLYRIPVAEFTNKVGDIEDFKSIRFMRMYMRGFSKQTTLRFATLDFVRGEWRRYQGSLVEGGEATTTQTPEGNFDIEAINIEENKNYKLPPGFTREIDAYQTQLRSLNEQSMVLKVTDLADGDARAAFKTAGLDMRQYKHLKMETHAEELNNQVLKNGELTLFIRMGSDFKTNYYEYEIPLKVTQSGVNIDAAVIWPDENKLDIELDIFQQLKQERNDLGIPFINIYAKPLTKTTGNTKTTNRISICGNPSLSNIKAIMIGVRNPIENSNGLPNDNLSKSAEIWVNELRLTDFSDKGGWAANARAQLKLADFGNLRVSGSTMQPGFGSIEKKVNDREKVETNQYDIASDVELGKFFPEKAQVRVPVYAAYSVTAITPQYNPLDPDIPLAAAIKNAEAKNELTKAQNIKENAIDFTRRRSINFTNIKVNQASKKPMPYDPANFSVSYGYNDQLSRNHTTVSNDMNHHEGSFNYIFNNRPQNVSPFQKLSFLNAKPFKLIKDINFYYAPSSFSFRTSLARDYREIKLRNLTKDTLNVLPPTVEKDFLWNRMYDLKYDLSRAIKIDFSAKNTSRIEEWDKTMLDDRSLAKKRGGDYNAWEQIKKGGHTTSYTHQLNIDYNVPINKLPLLSWLTLSTRYGANYEWQYRPKLYTDDGAFINLGNDISNSRTIQINSSASLSAIYAVIPFVKDLQSNTQRGRGGAKQKVEKEMKTVRFEKTYFTMKAGEPKNISHKLGSEDVTIKVTDAKGKEIKGKMDVMSVNRLTFTPDEDVSNANVVVEGKVEALPNPFIFVLRNTVRLATGVRSVSGSYSQTEGTGLPGYSNESKLFGSVIDNGKFAPGIPFILGSQGVRDIEGLKQYLSTNSMLIGTLVRTNTKSLNLRASYEPFNGLRIDLTAQHSTSRNSNASISANGSSVMFNKPTYSGTFSMSIISLSSFDNVFSNDTFNSSTFEKFKSNIVQMGFRVKKHALEAYGERYAQDVSLHEDTGGFGPFSQQVLIPDFLATYAGYGISGAPLELLPSFKYMRPNWRINFDGLTKIPIVEQYMQSVTITHAYQASYNIGSYASNLSFDDANGDGFNDASELRNTVGNYFPKFDVSSVSLTEQFSPFLGIDMTWKNNLTTRFEFKKSRNIQLGLTNISINDSRTKEYVVGLGYRFPDMPLTMLTFGAAASPIKSDLNVRTDITFRDDITKQRHIVTSTEQASAGNKSINIDFSADYSLSDRLNVSLFYQRMLTDPHMSSSFLTINSKFGFSIRFTLAQ